MRSCAVLIFLTLAHAAHVGCLFDDALPADARITCTSSGDCPSTTRCAGLLSRCVPDDGDLDAPDAIATMSSALLSADGTLDVVITPDEALGAAPSVLAGAIERASTTVDDSFVATFSAAELGAGAHAVSAVLVDASGNPGVIPIGIVTVDATDPGIDPDTPVRLTIVPPPGSPVASPTRVVVGSSVIIVFDVDEPLREPPVVTARGPADVPFSPVGEDDGAFVYAFEVSAPLAAGAYTVEVLLADVAGNDAVVVLSVPEPGFVADDVVPSPCVARDEDGVLVCTDFDGDGVDGLSAACPSPSPLDCDDTDPLAHPGAIEIAGDLKDNDCAGDGDTPLDDDTAVFADPAAAPGGDGTRAAPFADLFEATDAANLARKTLAMRAGSFGVVPDGWFTEVNVVGGLDASFAFDPFNASARTRIEFVTGNNTVFPSSEPQVYVGLDLVGPNGLIAAATPIALVRTRLEAPGSALSAGDVTFVDADVVSGFVSADRVLAYGSRFADELFAVDGLLLRTQHTAQIAAGEGGKLEVVSSSIAVVDKDRAARADGQLVLFGSNVRSLSSAPGDSATPAINVGLGAAFLFSSVAESSSAIAIDLQQGGSILLNGSAVSSPCGLFANNAGCLVLVDGAGCDANDACSTWIGALVIDDVAPDADDPAVLTNPLLAGPAPPLLEQGAPTSSAGDLVGRCRDTSAPSYGASEPVPDGQ